MELPDVLRNVKTIQCVDMHTTGEPARIVTRGFPNVQGTLLEQRAQAKKDHDGIRTFLMLEPRGHYDMYGAILRPETELVASGEAHMGVLFMHNEGFSTMCGHATVALGRFLVDCHDPAIFPKRTSLNVDTATRTIRLNLHAPCGLIKVTVPTSLDGQTADPTRPVSFISSPSFTPLTSINVPILPSDRWPELPPTTTAIPCCISYGGAFYCLVPAISLGFPNGLRNPDLRALETAASTLQSSINANADIRAQISHPDAADLSFLYSVMITDGTLGTAMSDTMGVETGLCFFADRQIDRSPTGSCVAARLAAYYAQGLVKVGQKWTFESLVSRAYGGKGAFVGGVVEECEIDGGVHKAVRVRV